MVLGSEFCGFYFYWCFEAALVIYRSWYKTKGIFTRFNSRFKVLSPNQAQWLLITCPKWPHPPNLIDDDKTAQGPKALPTASSNAPLSSIPTAITHSEVYNCDEMSLIGRADKIRRGHIFEGKGSNKKGWVDEVWTAIGWRQQKLHLVDWPKVAADRICILYSAHVRNLRWSRWWVRSRKCCASDHWGCHRCGICKPKNHRLDVCALIYWDCSRGRARSGIPGTSGWAHCRWFPSGAECRLWIWWCPRLVSRLLPCRPLRPRLCVRRTSARRKPSGRQRNEWIQDPLRGPGLFPGATQRRHTFPSSPGLSTPQGGFM